MAKAYLGDHDKPCGVIYNGTVASLYDGPPSVVRPRPYAVAVAKWRPHKRLRDAVESFLLAGLDADLLVFGDCVESGLSVTDCAQYAETGRVVFCGRVDQATLAGYLKAAVCSIHLCWFDACPNSVVEALCAGVPVVTNNVGGTHELVRLACPEDADWLVCGVDATYTCNPVDLYRPPRIDRGVVAAAIARCFYKLALVDRAALSIKRSADAYLNLMVRLCNQT
jgi:glycosyltransferase involved in cell wall biosynthesis